jgi:RimJ/RimL family protein N-acetyltransferase
MIIAPNVLEGEHVRLEPLAEAHRAELAKALDCDAANWAIQAVNGRGEGFAGFWNVLVNSPGRIGFAVRDRKSGGLAGTSSFIGVEPRHATLEIGSTWLRPEYRGTLVNPEAKLLMMGEAFGAGALRVQFSVDTRNQRSQAAMLKLGAVREGVVRRHLVTWTGHKRDTVLFSVIDSEWPEVERGLRARLGKGAGA